MINSDRFPCHIPRKDELTSVSNFIEVQTERLCHNSSKHGIVSFIYFLCWFNVKKHRQYTYCWEIQNLFVRALETERKAGL